MLRTLKGVVLGLIAQGAGHLALTLVFQVHIYPPNAWHLLPFVLGGLVCGAYARSGRPGFFVALPYAALIMLADVMVGPRLSAWAVLITALGIAIGVVACGLTARRKRTPAPMPPAPAPPPAPPST
jgi:uncharacterized membrane protein YccC